MRRLAFRSLTTERGFSRCLDGAQPGASDASDHGIRQDREGEGGGLQRTKFATRYTAADVNLLAYVDKAHGNLSGPATRRILEREHGEYGRAVDQVTQWEIVAATLQISEFWLLPVLEALLEQFPFMIRGFHSDNRSEFINVAHLLKKLLIEQTKSRAHS